MQDTSSVTERGKKPALAPLRNVIERARWLRHAAVVPIIAGLVFLCVFQWAYSHVDPALYQLRDDGVITLSHGRNWIDFGFIGLNPSGERIEATSAPLQMLLYAAAYALTGVGYAAFMQWQTVLCTFALGCCVAAIFAQRPRFALLAAAASAVVLAQMGSFLVWHGSGMENALMHVFLAWTVLVLYTQARAPRIDLRWSVVPFLASIVRVEAIYYVAPLLVVFCIWSRAQGRGAEARRFAVLAGALWLAFNLCRYLYFGALVPNTAVAQGISVGDRLIELLSLSPTYLEQSFVVVRILLARHGAYLLLLALPLLLLRPRPGNSALLLALCGTVIVCSLMAPFVFGQARLDSSRTTTHMALFVVIAVAAAAFEWEPRRIDLYSLPAVAAVVFVIHQYSAHGAYDVCCSAQGLEGIRAELEEVASANDMARPTVANPDLGAISWHKQFNLVDLGYLGSSVLAHLRDDKDSARRYLLDYAAPDIVETHAFWTCLHAGVLTDPRFSQRYVFAAPAGSATTFVCKGANVPTGIWVRRDVMRGSPTAERRLMDDLVRAPQAERIEHELGACKTASVVDPLACNYVARSAYRVLPELRAQGQLARVERAFEVSPSRGFAHYLLRGADTPAAYRGFLPELLKVNAANPA